MKVLFFLIILNSQIGFSQNLEQQIDSIITFNYKDDTPGISIIVAKNGSPIYKKAFGKSNLELDVSMTIDNVFQIGSITKQFTAVSILMLEEQGKLKVEDEITKYIPDYPTQGKTITIHHLLNHTSGIRGSTPVGNVVFAKIDRTPTEIIDYFKNKPMNFSPGEEFRYSNSGYMLLGYIIEVVSKQPYKDFIEKNIFELLEMNSTYYGSNSAIIKNRAAGYQIKEHEYVNADYMSLTLPYAAGSIMSTVGDLLKWQNAINSNKLIKKARLKKAITASKLNNGREINYGYGWRLGTFNGAKGIGHNGSTFGYKGGALLLLEDNVYIVALSNCNCGELNKLSEVIEKVATIFIKKRPVETKVIKFSTEILNKYIGKYELKPNFILEISIENSDLFVKPPNKPKREIFAIKKDHFFLKDQSTKLIFNYNDKGIVSSLTIVKGNRQRIANKINI